MKRYIRASFTNEIPEWLKKDKSALSALNRAGIDLHNATFSKEREGKMKDNYVVYLIKQPVAWQQRTSYKKDNPNAKINYNEFIWIPGVYNDDHYVSFINYDRYDPYMHDYKTSDKAVKYFSKKDLNIVDTIYIYDGGDNIKSRREHYQDPRYDKNGRYAGQQMIPESWHWNGGERETVPAHWSEQGTSYSMYDRNPRESNSRDKSGYVIPDPQERLRKFNETEEGQTRQAQKASRELELIFGQLVNLKDKLAKDFNANAGSLDTFGKNTKSIDYFREALDAYKQALQYITVKEYGGKQYYLNLEGALDYIERAKSRIRYAEKSLETGITYSSRW